MSEPRHRVDPSYPAPPLRRISYEPPVPVRSIDFDAVAPMRGPAPYSPETPVREPSGDGPDQWAEEDASEIEDALHLAHS